MEISVENKTVKKKRFIHTIGEIFLDMMDSKFFIIVAIIVVNLLCALSIQAYSAFYYRDDAKWCTLHVRDSVFKVVDTQTDTYKVTVIIQNIDTKEVGSIELKNESHDKISANYKTAVSLDAGDMFMIEDKAIKLLEVDS